MNLQNVTTHLIGVFNKVIKYTLLCVWALREQDICGHRKQSNEFEENKESWSLASPIINESTYGSDLDILCEL